MRAILLAAGYATRMYPFTRDCPKPLLPVAGVPMLDYILAKVFAVPQIEAITLVSNHKFHEHFANYLAWRRPPRPISLLDDGTTTNEGRLGAIRDIQLAIDHDRIGDDVLVLATDNLFAFPLPDFVDFARGSKVDAVVLRHEPDPEARKRTGIAEVDADQRIIDFEEKPSSPKSAWAVPPFYCYRRETLPEIQRYLDQGGNPDAPGHFVAWLHKEHPVYGFPITGEVLDIGNPESYAEANRTLNRSALAALGVQPW